MRAVQPQSKALQTFKQFHYLCLIAKHLVYTAASTHVRIPM